MFGIRDRTLTGKLIRFLTVLATTLAVALSGDGSVTAARCSNLPGCQHEIDVRENVVDAIGVMFYAAGVHHHGGLGATV